MAREPGAGGVTTHALISLTRAVQDRRLLGADPALALWPRQLELLQSLEGPERTHLWSIGRQSGKTTLAALAAIHNATMRPDLDDILPRRRRRYVLVAGPGEEQSREFIAICKGFIEDSPLLRSMAKFSATRIDFSLPSGRSTVIRALPANSKTLRGMSASLVVGEEFAHFSSGTGGPGSDERMYRALRPSMRRFGSKARMLLVSTPDGEHGKFFELFRDAESGALPMSRAVRAPSWEVDPTYDEAQREADRHELGEDGYAEEVGAEFITGRSTFFDLDGIAFATAPALPSEGKKWIAGLDAAFSEDFFGVCVVGESIASPGTLVLGAAAAIKPERTKRADSETFEDQRRREDTIMHRVLEVLEPYAPSRAVADRHKGGPVRTFLGRQGISVNLITPSSTRDKQMFVSTKSRLEDGTLRLWAHAQLMQDLRRVRTTDSDKIHLPKLKGAGHCDVAMALALATFELRSASGAASGSPSSGRVNWDTGELGRPTVTPSTPGQRAGGSLFDMRF